MLAGSGALQSEPIKFLTRQPEPLRARRSELCFQPSVLGTWLHPLLPPLLPGWQVLHPPGDAPGSLSSLWLLSPSSLGFPAEIQMPTAWNSFMAEQEGALGCEKL